MNHEETINRREALYRLALLPLTISGLTATSTSLKLPLEEIFRNVVLGLLLASICDGGES